MSDTGIRAAAPVSRQGHEVTPSEVDRIVALDDQPVLRNLLISQAYHDLSEGMVRLFGEKKNIAWVTMASWSSKTAGRFIRLDDLPDLFKYSLRQSSSLVSRFVALGEAIRTVHPALALDPFEHLIGTVDRILRATSDYLTLGNKVVFAELGGIFAGFIDAFAGDTSPDPKKLDRYLATIPEGPPQPDEVWGDARTGGLASREVGGKTLLREAMRNYYKALFTSDAKKRAELILLGNGQGGVHEQTRLQPYIAGSLDAAGSDLIYNDYQDAVLQVLADKAFLTPLRVVLETMLRPLAAEVEKLFREFATVELMKLKLPDAELVLGRDVPAPPGQPLYPPSLQTLDNPTLCQVFAEYDALDSKEVRGKKSLVDVLVAHAQELLRDLGHVTGRDAGTRPHDLAELLQRIREVVPMLRSHSLDLWSDLRVLSGRAVGRPGQAPAARAAGSRATDWANLWQRMRYILPLFRSRAQDPALFGQIFSDSQRQALDRGDIPAGPLY